MDSYDGVDLLLDVLYGMGGVLMEDDIKDFPWDPMQGGPGHLKGGLHHGMIGYWMRLVATFGGLAKVGVSLAQELGSQSEIEEITRKYEKIAYPSFA